MMSPPKSSSSSLIASISSSVLIKDCKPLTEASTGITNPLEAPIAVKQICDLCGGASTKQ